MVTKDQAKEQVDPHTIIITMMIMDTTIPQKKSFIILILTAPLRRTFLPVAALNQRM
jgi:hypothetical protein